MSEAVLSERRGRTLIITINRPEARNAANKAVAEGLAAACDELDDTPELSVAVLTGAGGNFCAGMDLKAFAAGELAYVPGRGLGFTERPPRKPIISAVEGHAVAGGTELVLATDLVVAAKGRNSVSRKSKGVWWPPVAVCCGCRTASRIRRRWSWL